MADEFESNKNQINKQYMFATGHRLLGNNPKRKMELLGNKPKRKMERINKRFCKHMACGSQFNGAGGVWEVQAHTSEAVH